MINRYPRRRLGILLVAGCGVAGYAAGGGWDGARKKVVLTEIGNLHPLQTPSRPQRTQMDEFAEFQDLFTGGRETDIWKVVLQLPTARIPEALQRLRELQAVAASGSSDARRLAEIESAVYFRWAESDPVAALADVSTMPGPPDQKAMMARNALLKSVLAAWMRTDPNAAYRAVKDREDFGFTGRDMLVQTWTAENVFQNLKLFPDKSEDLLGWYCIAVAGDEGQRNAMLKALMEQPNMKDRDWGYFMLFRQWAYMDFPAAMAEAKKHDHPGLEQHVFEDGLSVQSAATIRWAVSQNIPPGGVDWEQGYRSWLRSDSADAQKWLDEQAPAWISQGHIAAVAGFRAEQLRPARGGKLVPDTDAAGQKLVQVVTEWKNKDPQAAANWLETAPDEARKLFIKQGAGNE
jgi:hypothetical protein